MINGMDIFYNPTVGKGLEPVQTKGKGTKPVQNKSKKGGSCNKKCDNKKYKGSGLKILN